MPENTEEAFSSDNYEQIADSAEQVSKVMRWFEEAKKYRKTREAQWRINEDLLRNKIDMSGARTETDMRFNIPLAVVESIKPGMSDFLPTFDIVPDGRNDVYWADMMQKRKKQIEDLGKFKTNMLNVISDSLEYSDGILEVRPVLEDLTDEVDEDGNAIRTLKGVEFNAIDMFTWYPAPHSTGMILGDECRFQIFATPMHKDEIKRELGLDVQGEGKLDDQRAWIKSSDDDETTGDYSLVLACYSADVDKEKYPYGRVTIVVENKLHSDEPLDMYRIPYFQLGNYKSKHDTFGYGEPELVATQTKGINEAMSSIFDGLREAGNPKVKIKRRLFNKLTGRFRSKKYLEVDTQDDVTYLQPSSPSASMFSAVELTLQLVDVVTGTNDVSSGRNNTSNVTSGRAIMALQEAQQARVRYKISKEVVPLVEDVGRMVGWLIKNFDTEMISIREQLRDGGQTFSTFDPNATPERAREIAEAEGKDFNPEEFGSLQDTQFNIRVAAGFSPPSGRLARKEEADINFDAGRIGIEQWVQDTAHPDGQTVIKEFYERQGDAQRKEIQQEVSKDLPDIIEAARENPEEFQGSAEEDSLMEMVMQLPEILISQDFMSLPAEIKTRIATAVANSGGEANA